MVLYCQSVVLYCQNMWFFTVKIYGFYCQNMWFFTAKIRGSLLSKFVVLYCPNMWFFTVKICGSLLSKYLVLYCQNVWFFIVKMCGSLLSNRMVHIEKRGLSMVKFQWKSFCAITKIIPPSYASRRSQGQLCVYFISTNHIRGSLRS